MLNLNGWRQPKGGRWSLELGALRPPLPPTPQLSIPWKALGCLALLVVFEHLMPASASAHFLPLIGLAAANWPGTTALPALGARRAWNRKSLQLPWASGNGETDAPEILWGTGDPNGVLVGTIGDEYVQTDGAAGQYHWYKVFGLATNTGWVRGNTILSDKTYSAAWFPGATFEAKLTAAIAAAKAAGVGFMVWVSAAMLPFNPANVTFDNAVRVVREGGNPLYADIRAYGAAGNNTQDDTPAIQAATNYALDWPFNSFEPVTANHAVVYMPVGDYKTTKPIEVFRFSGGAFNPSPATTYCGITIQGEKWGTNGVGNMAARLIPTFKDTAVFFVQNVRGVRIADLVIHGLNELEPILTTAGTPNWAAMMVNSNYVTASCRDSRYSPYAAVVIDPFGTSVPADGGYPGYADHYVANATGASQVELERLSIRSFVTGISLSPNGTIANGDTMTFKNITSEFCKVGFSCGQDQARCLNWYGGSVAFTLYGFDGNTYGKRQGYAPHIYGVNMGFGKYLFNVDPAFGINEIHGVHAESFASIGFFGKSNNNGSYPVSFTGCEFEFFDMTGVFADHQLVAWSPVTFDGCHFSMGDATKVFPWRFYHDERAPLTFHSCVLHASVLTPEFWFAPTNGSGAAGDGVAGIYFDGSLVAEGGGGRAPAGGISLVSANILNALTSFDRGLAPLSTSFRQTQSVGAILGDAKRVGGSRDSISLGTLAITLTANGTATFTASDATILELGDLVYNYTATNYEKWDGTIAMSSNQECIGIITNINGTTITISGVPQNLPAASYALRLEWWARYHQDSIGDTTSASASVTNVTNPTTWGIGNRIKGVGIPAGTYVTNVVGSTLTISKNATATATKVRLYDADLYTVRGEAMPGVSADNGDAAKTLTATQNNPTQLWATTLTANRVVTLSTANASNGSKFRIVRTGLGAFTLDVGGLQTIPASTAAIVDVEYDGAAWKLTNYVVIGGDVDQAVITGGFRQTIDGWYQENVAASQTDVALTRLATTTEAPTRWIAVRAGSVTGVNVKSNAARAGGTLTIKVFKNGTQLGTLTAVLDGTNTTFKATLQAKDTVTFVAGDELELTLTTDAGWLPVTADVRAALEIET